MVAGGVCGDARLREALSDPKKVNALLLMEPLPGYAVDHVLRDITEIAELIAASKANGQHG